MKIMIGVCLVCLMAGIISPVQGSDFNGDGVDDLAIFRPSSGLWAVRGITRVYFGAWNDEPVPGDYDGGSGDEIAIYRATSGLWAIRGFTRAYYGSSGDIPIANGADADWYRAGNNLCALAAGNIGIGTGTPQEKLHLLETFSIPDIRLERGAGGEYWDVGGKTGIFLNFDYTGTRMATFDGVNSRVGISNSSPEYTLDAVGDQVRLRWSTQSTAETIAMRTDGAAGIVDIEADNADLFLKSNSGDTMIQPFGGKVGIGVTNPSYAVDINGPVMLRGQSGNPTTGNPWAGIFAKPITNAELWTIDGMGNTNQITPHDPGTGEWIFYSKNIKTGRVVRVEMEKMVRYFDQLTGTDFYREWQEEPSKEIVALPGKKFSAPAKEDNIEEAKIESIPRLQERIQLLEEKIAVLEKAEYYGTLRE